MILWCYEKCSTCKKARKFLDDNNISYEYKSIVSETPSPSLLNKMMEIKKSEDIFFNSSGNSYKNMNMKDLKDKLTKEEKIKYLSRDGMLIKRPLLYMDDKVLVGFKQKEWEELI